MRARLLGIAVGEQLHRALEVGEQDRDLLALAFEGAARGEDPLGQVPRRVGLRGGELRRPAARPSAAPQSPQNFWPGGLFAPHEEQTDVSLDPHAPQYELARAFSSPHEGHCTARAAVMD